MSTNTKRKKVDRSQPPFTREQPDLTKPLSRWSAVYWAQAHGVQAALKSDARWAVFEALCFHLPDVKPGAGRLEAITGLSERRVWDAKKALRSAGLIQYDDSKGGRTNTTYKVADTRNVAVCAQIVAMLDSAGRPRKTNAANERRKAGQPPTPATVAPPTGQLDVARTHLNDIPTLHARTLEAVSKL